MTRDEKSEAVAARIRQGIPDSSTAIRHNEGTTSVEIDVVHPKQGPRLVALSDEFLDDNDLAAIEDCLDRWGVVGALGEGDYLPIVVTNNGPRPYRP